MENSAALNSQGEAEGDFGRFTPEASIQRLDAVPNTTLAIALEYWRTMSSGSDMPLRAKIDPTNIPSKLLPWTVLLAHSSDGFTFRLVGSGHYEIYGYELTGTELNSLYANSSYDKYIARLYRNVVASGKPIYSSCDFWGDNGSLNMQRLLTPLGSVELGITHILGFFEIQEYKRVETAPGVLHRESAKSVRHRPVIERIIT